MLLGVHHHVSYYMYCINNHISLFIVYDVYNILYSCMYYIYVVERTFVQRMNKRVDATTTIANTAQ